MEIQLFSVWRYYRLFNTWWKNNVSHTSLRLYQRFSHLENPFQLPLDWSRSNHWRWVTLADREISAKFVDNSVFNANTIFFNNSICNTLNLKSYNRTSFYIQCIKSRKCICWNAGIPPIGYIDIIIILKVHFYHFYYKRIKSGKTSDKTGWVVGSPICSKTVKNAIKRIVKLLSTLWFLSSLFCTSL